MALAVKTLNIQNHELADAVNRVGGRVVFAIDTIFVKGETTTGPKLQATRNGDVFKWGPSILRYGTLSGEIDTRDSIPSFTPTFTPATLHIGFAVVQHDDRPWEALISVEPYGETEIRTIPQISTRLTNPAEAPCGHLLFPICDASIRASGGFATALDRAGPIFGLDGSIAVFSRRTRLNLQVDSWPSARTTISYRLK
jgi:hypothetical protein